MTYFYLHCDSDDRVISTTSSNVVEKGMAISRELYDAIHAGMSKGNQFIVVNGDIVQIEESVVNKQRNARHRIPAVNHDIMLYGALLNIPVFTDKEMSAQECRDALIAATFSASERNKTLADIRRALTTAATESDVDRQLRRIECLE